MPPPPQSLPSAPPLTPSRGRERHDLPPPALRMVVALVDALLVGLALILAIAIGAGGSARGDALRGAPAAIVLAVAGLASQRAYELERIRNGYQVLARLVLGLSVALGLIGLVSFVAPEASIPRGILLLHGALLAPLLVAWRRYLFHALREAALRSRAVVLGDAPLARKVAAALASARFCGAEVVGILTPGSEAGSAEDDRPIPRLGGYDRLKEVARRYRVSQAIVVSGPHDAALPVEDLVALRKAGLRVEDGSETFEAATGKLLVEKLTPSWLVFANAFERSALEMAARRALGAVLAGTALLALSPFLVLVALLVKLDSPGPVFFRQLRVGERGRAFELFKFRTMRADAEARSGPVWAQAHDPRVTRLGRILRSTRIDELPQLWNVLRGEMYFVGPRPERPHFVELLQREVPHYDQRHSVKPGITGWAQINYRYGSSVEDAVEKLHYDLFYIQNMSTLLDAYILLGTVRVMLGASNRN